LKLHAEGTIRVRRQRSASGFVIRSGNPLGRSVQCDGVDRLALRKCLRQLRKCGGGCRWRGIGGSGRLNAGNEKDNRTNAKQFCGAGVFQARVSEETGIIAGRSNAGRIEYLWRNLSKAVQLRLWVCPHRDRLVIESLFHTSSYSVKLPGPQPRGYVPGLAGHLRLRSRIETSRRATRMDRGRGEESGIGL
jgi:hypothetical protein